MRHLTNCATQGPLKFTFKNGAHIGRHSFGKGQDLLLSSLGIECEPSKTMVELESEQGQFILFLKLNISLPQTPLHFIASTG